MKTKRIFSKTILRLALLSLLFGALPLSIPGPVYAAGNPAAVQVYYVTLPEADALTVLDAINSAATTPVTTYFSIAIGVSGTYVYYDQWENGYDSDLANPTNLYSGSNPGGTQIWGNGKAADGCAPNKNGVALSCSDANDVLSAGDVILPSNAIPIPRNSSVIFFDSRDKVGASSSIAMARAVWAGGPGTLNAFAHEMYATAEWGTAYESPVGTNTATLAQGYSGQGMFEYSALSVMASQNSTTVQIDKDANGSYETSITLNEGGATLVTGVSQGARVQTTDAVKPIQVVLVTGDIGSSYESRDMNLLPVSAYGSSYWSPVGVNTGVAYTPGPTRVFLYSPSTGGPTHITCKRRSPTPTTVTQAVSARGIVTVDLNDNSGANCYASNSSGAADTSKIIFAIGTIDTAVSGVSAGQAGDWSFTLYPDSFLSTDALVGLGLGRDPTSGSNPTENGSPLWVTPACNTYIYVDWNNDGAADRVDLNGDGDTGDTIDGISEGTSNNGMSITQLKSVRLFKPSPRNDPYSQSGARVWSRTASGVGRGGIPGCNLAVAWGQDPRRASAAAPGLDVGTSVPPLRLMEGTKSMELKTDADGDGVLSPGDTATTNITIKNTGSSTVNDVYVYDAGVPANTTYVANSTQKDVGSGWTAISDDGSGTAFPLDITGGVLLGNLDAGAIFYVRFDVTLNNTGGAYEQVSNCDIAYTAGGNVTSCTTNLVASNDWGDLPDTYSTSLAANGPRHSPTNNDPALTLRLGSAFDRDLQGQPSTGADGDDLTYHDDEDGIVIGGAQPAWQSGGTGKIQVTVAGGDGCLNAWMDFTNDSGAVPPAADGNFTNASGGYDSASTISEHIVQNVLVSAGTQTVNVTVPPGAIGAAGAYFRFRLSQRDGSNTCTAAVAPTGFVSGGEVEDYHIVPADLSITKSDGLTTVTPGSTLVYTLVVKNNGAATATGVTLEDTLGANLSYVGSTCGTPAGSYPTYSWTLADLPAGQSTSCTVSVAVASPLADGTQLTNYAHVSTTALEVNTTDSEVADIDTVLNVALPDLWVTKSDGNTQVLAGDTLVYTIQYGNAGTVGATSVNIVDGLPANVTYQSSNPAGSLVGSTLTWSIGNLAAGGSGSIEVTVEVNSDQLAGAVVLNHVSIDGAENDKNPLDDSALDSNTVIAPYVVTEKSASGPDPVSGELTYAITWVNNSTAMAANVQLQDTLPANTTLVAGSISGGGTYDSGTRAITWNLGDQPSGASGTVSFRVTLGAGAGSATQTAPTLSTETGSGSVTLTSKTTAYSSLPWCDSAYNPKCLTYRGLFQNTNGVGPTGWNENPRATLFDDSSWTQPVAASTNEAYYWLPASTLAAEWTAVNTTGLASENYTFFRQAFCTPLNASNLTASLSLASDDISTVYLNGISVGQHTGAGGYSTLDAGAGIQSGINILAVRLLNNSHGGHPFPTCPGCDHSGLLFNLQASYSSLRPFAYGPAMSLAGQSATLTVDENALGGRTPYSYKFDFGDGAVVDFQSGTSQSHTYSTPGTYVATVTARAAYGCTGSDQVVVQVLPDGSALLANLATVSYQSTTGTSFSGQTGAGLPLTGAVGDRVWLDEDGDGVQDAGEAGIANVKVTLTNGVQTYITYTDANGNYVFANVPAGAYTVSIDPASMPSGLAANPTYDEDKTLDHTTSVDLKPGVEHMTADFGYNWASITDVTNPGAGATGAIGDRVWIDADGDGLQDAEELGLAGVTVTIYYDPDGNGVYDTPYPNAFKGDGTPVGASGSVVTDFYGNYIFDGLPAGAYEIRVTGGTADYAQTGDPDQPGAACTACDARTTAPIILAPGDVVVNADFGYLPNTGVGATIGGQLWLDTDANGALGGVDSSLAGVTVALIEDTNGNGVWDTGEPVVATDITNAGGAYQFDGVPVGGNYLVWVNDAASILPALSPTYDTNGIGTPGISAVASLTAAGDQAQNFGYTPAAQTAGKGLIGDKIFLDLDGNGAYTPGEGLEGVTVRLYADSNGNGVYDTGEPALAQTTTNELGTYTFGDLPAGTYVVVVDTATLPGGGLTNTADPNGGAANQSGVSLAAGQVDLGQDFGYQGTNTVSGAVWKDANADGTLTDGTGTTPDETGNGMAGVTLALYDAGGNLIATTTTDASGNYSFANLPNGAYTVDVTDEANVLDGFWKSACPAASCGSDGYSQVDPYQVTLTGSQTNTTADFGYYRDPATLGNRVWYDANANGLQDSGELGIAGVVVNLTVTYPNGATTVISTVTDASGTYSFANLLLDENYDVPDGDKPSYVISVTPPSAYPYPADPGVGSDRAVDSGLASGETIDATRGSLNDTYDFGFSITPTAVQLLSFSAALQGDAVLITWETAQELNNLGFNLYRSVSPVGPWMQLNATLIPSQAPGAVFGADYAWLDETVEPETVYFYRLEDVDTQGVSTFHGPVSVTVSSPAAVTLVAFDAGGNSFAGLSLLLALASLALGSWKRRRAAL